MRSKKFIAVYILLFTIAIFLSLKFDDWVIQAVSNIRTPILTQILIGITFTSSEIVIFFFLTSLFLFNEGKRKWIFPLWLTLFFSVILSFILKFAIQRLRPFQQDLVSIPEMLASKSYDIWNFSFPSFQAMLVFCALPIISKEFPKIKWFWIVFAILVAFSRVYFGLHFLSDVLVGGILGYLIGVLVIKLEKKKKLIKRIFGR